ncbi:MAG: type III PLP-dependent enzyme [Alphaproteobacteria bacterium]|nr:type III PLP-dependent enzyme [Alphaproteobacteria bacterium]
MVPPQPQAVAQGEVTAKIARYLADTPLNAPTLVIDLDVVEHAYLSLRRALPLTKIYYAIKANPAPEVIQRLAPLGCYFDTASQGEIDLCLSLGVAPDRIGYGNTIKKRSEIAHAFAKGVRLFAFDSQAELEKLAELAPGSQVFCRVLVDCAGADWPLSKKFGCTPRLAIELLTRARDLGLDPVGISFHVGSQQTDPSRWEPAIATAAEMSKTLAERGIEVRLLNIGGGFPSRYRTEVPALEAYGKAIMASMNRHFAGRMPEIIVEPGRQVVGDAGVIQAEVVLVSEKDIGDEKRWVYLDIGKFSGLAETIDEAIKYRIKTPHDGGPAGPVVLAGPSCDSVDTLYEKTDLKLPLALTAGDKVLILSTGAYTSAYSSVGFNGFPPLKTVCI